MPVFFISHFVFRRHCWFNTYKQQFSESGFLPDRLPIVVLTKAESEVDKPDEQTTSLEDSNRNKDVNRPNLTGSPHLSNLSSSLDTHTLCFISNTVLNYGFCKKLLRYKWTSDQLNIFPHFWLVLLCTFRRTGRSFSKFLSRCLIYL